MLLFCSLEVVSKVAVISSYQKKIRAIQLPAEDNVATGIPEIMARAPQVCSESRLRVLSTIFVWVIESPELLLFTFSPERDNP